MDELLKFLLASTAEGVDANKVKEKAMDKSIDECAIQIKKIYDSFVKVGFNEVQAFELVKVQLSSMRISR
jgi:hypothetical protein